MAAAPPSSDWTTEEGQWVLLVCIPHVVSDTVLPPPTDLSIEREHPPQAFRLTVPRRVAPDPKSIYNHPYVSSAGDFGRLVLYATHGTQPVPPVVDDFNTDAEPEDRFDYIDYPKELFLCDLNTRTATLLPRPDPERPRPIVNPGSVGLLATSATKSIILHLQTSPVSNLATLLCYTSDDNRWTVQNLFYPLSAPGQQRWKGGDGVIKYMQLMLWVDLACGILTLNTNLLLEGRPELRYVPLPQECQLQVAGLARERCVGVSAGKVRFLEISNYERIRLWTLVDIDTGGWTLDHHLDLENLRDEDGFKAVALDLPNECPGVAFIHPEHPTMAYFFQESRLFHVDMSTGKFINGQYFMMDNPPADYHSSRFVRPWKLPQQLFSELKTKHSLGGRLPTGGTYQADIHRMNWGNMKQQVLWLTVS